MELQVLRKYVSNNLYDNSSFYKVCTADNEVDSAIKIEVIQGGNVADDLLFQPIELETTKKTGLKHQNGTISMARSEPNTAQSSFFICINDQPELDFGGKRNPDGQGFAAFGKVSKGMKVVLDIQNSENKNHFASFHIRQGLGLTLTFIVLGVSISSFFRYDELQSSLQKYVSH